MKFRKEAAADTRFGHARFEPLNCGIVQAGDGTGEQAHRVGARECPDRRGGKPRIVEWTTNGVGYGDSSWSKMYTRAAVGSIQTGSTTECGSYATHTGTETPTECTRLSWRRTCSAEIVTERRARWSCPWGANAVGNGLTMPLRKLRRLMESEALTEGSDGLCRNYSQTLLSSVKPCEEARGAMKVPNARRASAL